MKQSTASIPVLAETFYLSQGERQLLVTADVGEGIFFAGQNHVALRVVASDEEHQLITTNPEEIYKRQQAAKVAAADNVHPPQAQTPNQPAAQQKLQQKMQTDTTERKSQNLYSIDDYAPPEK